MTVIRSKADLYALDQDKNIPVLIFDTCFDPNELIDLREYPIQSIIFGTLQLPYKPDVIFPYKNYDAGKIYTKFSYLEFSHKLPQSLESLTYALHTNYGIVNSNYDIVNAKIPFKMMKNLRILEFNNCFNGEIDFNMLPNLERINFGSMYDHKLPDSFFQLKYVKHISLVTYNHVLPSEYLNSGCFPQLEELFLHSYDHPLDLTLFTQLKVLTLGKMSYPLAGKLPHHNLEELNINSCNGEYNHPLDHDFEKFHKLKRLSLGGKYDHPLPTNFRLLLNLTFLWLGNYFNQEVDGYYVLRGHLINL